MTFEELRETEYWEKRYSEKNEEYEWYQPWWTFRNHILPYMKKTHTVLNIGCGNSPMGIDMINEGISRVINLDISPTVIQQMRERYQHVHNAEWVSMDCTNLKFKDNSFDLIIEKGTIDALVVKDDQGESVKKMLSETFRVLAPGGAFFSISFGKPSLRLPYYHDLDLQWTIHDPIMIPKLMLSNQYYYMYIATKT